LYNKTSCLEDHLVQKGYKLTKHRKSILGAFLELEMRWITAYQLFEKVSSENQKINFSTIYRNLEILTDIGILCKVDKGNGANYYRLNNEDNHHHHLICKSCGKTCKIDFCPLSEMNNDQFKGFTIVEHKFEVYGYCKECKAAKNKLK